MADSYRTPRGTDIKPKKPRRDERKKVRTVLHQIQIGTRDDEDTDLPTYQPHRSKRKPPRP